MAKQTKVDLVPENREYPIGSITLADVRDTLGDHVADQMTDALMKQLAGALEGLALSDDWVWAYALEDDVDLGEASRLLG